MINGVNECANGCDTDNEYFTIQANGSIVCSTSCPTGYYISTKNECIDSCDASIYIYN